MKKRNTIIVLSLLTVLAIAIVILAVTNAPKDKPVSGTISIISNGATLRIYTMEEIGAMEYIEVYKKIESSSYADVEGTFRGISLHTLLEKVDPSLLTSGKKIVVRSEDAFVTAFSADEVSENDNIFVAYMLNNKPLGTLKDGGMGPFRIIIQNDQFGNRSAKYVCEIEVQ
jgi:hypothetical protein